MMKKLTTKDLVLREIMLLIPFIFYSLYKNGYLIYSKGLINGVMIFKIIYLILISLGIKLILDLIKYHHIKIDYNLIYALLVPMIVPYNINLILYSIIFFTTYLLNFLASKYLKWNPICFSYLLIILGEYLVFGLEFRTPLEISYEFSFSLVDLLMGRLTGGIASTSIIFSLMAFTILVYNFYYKKDIPLSLNLTYILLTFSYFLITKDSHFILNSEVIFASIFIAPLPEYSPFRRGWQILYGVLIGIITFIISITFNSVISINLAIFIVSLLNFVKIRQNMSKKPSC